MRRLLALVVMAIMLAAMGWLNFRWIERPVDLSPIASGNASPTADADGAMAESGSRPELRTEITETLLRPLFHASRRPFTPPPPVTASAPVGDEELVSNPTADPEQPALPETKPDLRLAGVSISGGQKRALLGLATGSDVQWYTQGDNLDGWIVASITNQTVTLANGDKSFTVPLYPSSAKEGVEQ